MPDPGLSAADLALPVQAVLNLGRDLDATSIAEALWLAARAGGGAADIDATPATSGAETAAEGPDGTGADGAGATAPRRTGVPRPGRATGVPPTRPLVAGRRVRVARARPFPQQLPITRSLRPFKLRWPRGRRMQFDIDATVAAYARTWQLLPVYTPAPERWFEVALVVDDSPSMAVWAEETAGLSAVLRHAGTFTTVRDFQLSVPSTGEPPALSNEAYRPYRADQLLAPDGRRVILVVTDGAAPGWRHPAVWRTLRGWAESTPTVLVSPLATRLWRRTGLDLPAVRIGSTAPGSRNATLRYQLPLSLWHEDQPERAWLPLPAVTLNPNRIGRWARMLMRGDPIGSEALLIPPEGRPAATEPALEPPRDRDVAAAFLRVAAPAAARLAVLCSPFAAVSLPLLRLIRQQLVPDASTGDLAEIVISRLFRPPDLAADGDVLRFRDEARQVLQESLTESDGWRVYDALRARIDNRSSARTFDALVPDPAGDIALPAELLPSFAETERGVLDVMDFLDVLPDTVPVIGGTAADPPLGPADQPDSEQAADVLTDEAGHPITSEDGTPITSAPIAGLSSGQGIAAEAGLHLQVNLFAGPESGGRRNRVVIGNVPQAPSAFQPREDLLAALDSAGPGVSVVRAVTGMRGVGKTQLAAAYAREKISLDWRLVAWINAEDTGTLLAGLAMVADALGLGDTATAEQAGLAVRNWLESDGDRCLIVFDNVSDAGSVLRYLPAAGRAQVLITSVYSSVIGLGRPVDVGVFTADEALAFLAERTGRDDAEGAADLAAELGYLPLALAQAASVISAQRLTYGAYLNRLRAYPAGRYLPQGTGDAYPRGLAEAVMLSLAEVRSGYLGPLCGTVIETVALLSPVGVPRDLLHAVAESPATLIDEALGRLAGSSLLSFTLDGQAVLGHRLVMRVIRDDLVQSERLPVALQIAAGTLVARARELTGMRDRAAARAIPEQATALHDNTSLHYADDPELTPLMLELRSWAVYYLNELGDSWSQAIAVGESLVSDLGRQLGPDHRDTLAARNNLAIAYQGAGRSTEAANLFEQAHASRAELLGPDHPSTLFTLGNLASAYQAEGRITEATDLFERTLAGLERVLGPDNPRTFAIRNNLAGAYRDAGRGADAIPLLQRTLAACERVLGADHLDTLISRNNLAIAYQTTGQPEVALSLLQETLAARERLLGPDHPHTLASLSNLAINLQELGRPAEALPLLQRALTAREHLLGPEHPDTVAALNNVAITLNDLGRPAEALPLLQRAASVSERTLGTDHPDTLAARNNLGNALATLGELAQAVPLYEQNLAAFERLWGPAHPDTLIARRNLANARTAVA